MKCVAAAVYLRLLGFLSWGVGQTLNRTKSRSQLTRTNSRRKWKAGRSRDLWRYGPTTRHVRDSPARHQTRHVTIAVCTEIFMIGEKETTPTRRCRRHGDAYTSMTNVCTDFRLLTVCWPIYQNTTKSFFAKQTWQIVNFASRHKQHSLRFVDRYINTRNFVRYGKMTVVQYWKGDRELRQTSWTTRNMNGNWTV